MTDSELTDNKGLLYSEKNSKLFPMCIYIYISSQILLCFLFPCNLCHEIKIPDITQNYKMMSWKYKTMEVLGLLLLTYVFAFHIGFGV
jgi:hypothetical protein